MKKFFAYLKARPLMVAGTFLITITFFLEKILVRYEQEKIDTHDIQTVELLHTQSYITEKFIAKYLLEFNSEKIADSARRDRLRRKTLAEFGNVLINLDYMNKRRGLSSEEFGELTVQAGKATGELFFVVSNGSLPDVERFVDSLGYAFSLAKFEENQSDPYKRTFQSWAGHQLRLNIYTYAAIVLYAFGTVLLAVHAYLAKGKEEEEQEARFQKLKSFFQPAISALKKSDTGKKK